MFRYETNEVGDLIFDQINDNTKAVYIDKSKDSDELEDGTKAGEYQLMPVIKYDPYKCFIDFRAPNGETSLMSATKSTSQTILFVNLNNGT